MSACARAPDADRVSGARREEEDRFGRVDAPSERQGFGFDGQSATAGRRQRFRRINGDGVAAYGKRRTGEFGIAIWTGVWYLDPVTELTRRAATVRVKGESSGGRHVLQCVSDRS